MIKRIRTAFPCTRLIFRIDSHHTKPAVIDWLEEHSANLETGLQPNSRVRSTFTQALANGEDLRFITAERNAFMKQSTAGA